MEKPKKYKITIKMNPEDNKNQSLKRAFNEIKFAISAQETSEFVRRQVDPLDRLVEDNMDKVYGKITNS